MTRLRERDLKLKLTTRNLLTRNLSTRNPQLFNPQLPSPDCNGKPCAGLLYFFLGKKKRPTEALFLP
jgi:hypothetical protein